MRCCTVIARSAQRVANKAELLPMIAAVLKTRPRAEWVAAMEEAGVPGYETNSWNALFAPAGTPPEVIARLNEAANTAIQDPEVQKRLAEVGAQIVGSTPEELGEHVKAEVDRWRPVVEASGARIE